MVGDAEIMLSALCCGADWVVIPKSCVPTVG